MKLRFSLIILLSSLGIATSQAQIISINISDSDTTVYARRGPFSDKQYKGEKAIEYIAKQKSRHNPWQWDGAHWQGIGITYGGLISNLGNLYKPSSAQWMTQNSSSIGVDINLVDLTLVSSGCFGLFTGLGLEINNFRFDKQVTIGNDINGAIAPDWSYQEAGVKLSKTKLTTTYLQIPLMVEFHLNKRHNIWINGGIVVGLLINSHTKVKSNEFGIQKNHTDLNINNFHYGFEVGFGWNMFGLRARYYPQSIFRPGQGPHLEQVNVGIAIAF